MARMGKDTMMFNDVGRSFGSPKNLSTWREMTIKSNIKVKKKITPTGVRRFRILRLLVAAL